MRDRLLVRFFLRPRALTAASLLFFLYFLALFAPFLAPYEPSSQALGETFHPPNRIFWANGGFRVQLYRNVDPTAAEYRPIPGKSVPLKWLVHGFRYRFLGILPCDLHLFGVDPPVRIYLLGSDSTGRDVFSRLLYGARVSLSIGLVGVTLTTGLGLLVGGLAGYFGGIWDSLAMRTSELLMAIPGLYLLLALRAAFASHFSSDQMYFLILIILSLIGWSSPARIFRGLVLSLREMPFIQAARVLGLSPWRILWRHLLPNLLSYLFVSSTLSIPGYILGEAALSFLGIGIQEPSASWGLMLAQAQDIKVFALNFWWLLTPGVAIALTVICFNVLGDALRDAVDPRMELQTR
ncbi:ABC transporter permease [Candidatus Methylacidithermus pantelleriae]|uniref:ABC-type dipeptide/oligopeptide/nickel transport system, permease component n=1 Tax=Candidatus Methylacidithermus pantelleriae TaxID=2744239 RepID=A0A8J2FPX2_9BACT|nr:ABC transporter permease [Candidatus Methylacidithermus pantelleriae]CAF0705408.1 ABC-type dipeptide/oligopeptide/nickel transport system, permease component [Candidatus Methylacidithermus pantelleriae]